MSEELKMIAGKQLLYISTVSCYIFYTSNSSNTNTQ